MDSDPGIKLAFTQFNVEDLRTIGRACGATINDVFIAMVGRASQNYAQAHGLDTKEKFLKVHVPASVRRADQSRNMGNATSIVPVPVHLDTLGPLERLRAVAEFTRALKQCRAAAASNEVIKRILFWLTPPLMPFALRYAGTMDRQRRAAQNGKPIGANMVISNVARRPVPFEVLGSPILIRYALGTPLAFVGMNCVALTHGPNFGVSFAANPGRAPDLDRLCEFLEQAFDELRDAVAALPSDSK